MNDYINTRPLGWVRSTQKMVVCVGCGEEYLATFRHCWQTGTSDLRAGCPACGSELYEEGQKHGDDEVE